MSNRLHAPVNADSEVTRYYLESRSAFQLTMDACARIEISTPILIIFCAFAFVYPAALILLMIIYGVFSINFFVNSDKYKTLPMKLPILLKKLVDKHNPKVGRPHQFEKASATIHLGNERFNKKELWGIAPDMLLHLLVLGGTGAGKTEALLSINAASSILLGGASIYLDAKAAMNTSFRYNQLLRIVGREDSLKVLSFKTGNRSVDPQSWHKNSNTLAILNSGSAELCTNIIESMMPEGGQNQVFKDKALVILKGCMPCAVELRDKEVVNITPYLIGEFMSIKIMVQMAYPQYYDNQITYIHQDTGDDVVIPNLISARKRNALRSVLIKLGIQETEKALKDTSKQPSEVAKQFSYADGYVVKPLTDFQSTYGHIFECELGEIDTTDIIQNNHVFLIFIPAMEASDDAKLTQGKIGLSLVKASISLGLGPNAEGDADDVIHNLPIDLRYISTCTVDEYAEAAKAGNFAITTSQARGLGMSMIFSNQELASLLESSKDETNKIWGNTGLKIVLKLYDSNETMDYINKLTGKRRVLMANNLKRGVVRTFQNVNEEATIQEVEAVEFRDLFEQTEGLAHIIQNGKVIRSKMFYHGLPEIKNDNFVHVRQLEVLPPTNQSVMAMRQKLMSKVVITNMLDKSEYPTVGASDFNLPSQKPNDWIEQLLKAPVFEPTEDDVSVYPTSGPARTPQPESEPRETHSDVNETKTLHINPPKKKTRDSQAGRVVQNKSNTWVYGFKTSPNLANPKALADSIAALAKQSGVTTEFAEAESKKQVEKVAESMKYTSKEVEKTEQDALIMWDALLNSGKQ
ncbi:TraM recognition domain-containing protein [Alteromonas stellipolaris]|uniref:TraM recognition domain-containing protein n=1 Tax=Alteromonas stellipolaris TaxID=233316 RepID=UPI001DC6040D|nr:TraM recognition domain-containing protein [Alteromonas stellipolaris]MBZ2164162.1 TraM recognition domain-containing protein [Alteromonas stellipolaris]